MQRLSERLRTRVSFDIFCGLLDDSNRYRYIFCVVDQYSNYTIAVAARTRSTEEIINFFRQALFAYSVPSLLLCDGEPGLLNSKTFDDFLSLYDIQKQRTSLAFPQSNGLSERTNFFIKRSLRCFALTNEDNWSDNLPHVVSSINNAILCNNFSANQITFGNNDEHRADLFTLNNELSNIKEYMDILVPFVENARKKTQEKKA